jgi:prepilin-type processing-associated H-X9-DG protein
MNAMNATTADWTHVEPLLDEAMHALDETDRAAVLLRYFENKSLREVGATLGTSDDAAQKRVNRAVERLREFFTKRGVTTAASGLAVVISANAVHAAPAGLAVTISTAAALAGTTIAATTIATHTTMSWINIKSIAAIAAAALAAGLGTHLVQQNETNRLRSENQNLLAQQEQLTAQRDAVASPTANQDELERLRKDQADLLRLRGEVGTLRAQLKELDQLRAENQQLKSSLSQTAEADAQKKVDLDADPEKQAAMAKMNDAKLLVLGLIMYAEDNQKQLPADFNQTSNYFANANLRLTDPNQFELVLHGSLTNVTNPAETIAVREKQAWFAKGNWLKTYGFADGHVEVHTEAGGNFDAWEKQHNHIQPNQ